MISIQAISKCRNYFQRGMTLLELMIVLVVVAILGAIALPAYSDYVIRGKLADATSSLSDMRVKLEQSFQDNHTYIGASVCASPPVSKYFTFSCTATSDTAFVAQADGVASEGMSGFTFTIDEHSNRKTTKFYGASSTATCWLLKKGTSC